MSIVIVDQGLVVFEFRSIGVGGIPSPRDVHSTPRDVGLFEFGDSSYGVGHEGKI